MSDFTRFQAWAYDPSNPYGSARYSLTVSVHPTIGAWITRGAYERAVNAVGCLQPAVGLYLETESTTARRFFDRVLVRFSRGLPVASLRLWLKSSRNNTQNNKNER